MLPPPTLSFTIPSIHDCLSLECRIYHPRCLMPTSVAQVLPWRKKAAIVAHPYAPLGGSYDDAVVDLVASTILKEGFVVGTFNFRGAGSSKGQTSWSSLPEQKDYVSFLGFMVIYLHYLTVPYLSMPPSLIQSEPQLSDLTPAPSQLLLEPTNDTRSGRPTSAGPDIERSGSKPLLLLAGYSYGSLVTINLERSLLSIVIPFQQPVSGSPYADIRSRARFLATQQNEAIETTFSLLREGNHRRGRSLQFEEQKTTYNSRLSSSAVRMGGDEDIRRASNDAHRSGVMRSFSMDAPLSARKSLDIIKSMGRHWSPKTGQSYNSMANRGQEADANVENSEKHSQNNKVNSLDDPVGDFKVAYLLVSPLPPDGIINNLASIGGWRPTFFFGKQSQKMENDVKFTIDPTLFIYGTGDIFVQVKTFERWTEKLSGICQSREPVNGITFRYEEIAHGDHFWRNAEAARELKGKIRDFFMA
ncbi:hypothetical protein NHQ30_000469 [Ciborinia camelliae]|nr:hypothetical protein NHQ30_000469 [Ciborinia camelliae]